MDQETKLTAPEEQFEGQTPKETKLTEIPAPEMQDPVAAQDPQEEAVPEIPEPPVAAEIVPTPEPESEPTPEPEPVPEPFVEVEPEPVQEPAPEVAPEETPVEEAPALVVESPEAPSYSQMGLPEILMEFDRLLHLEDGTELQKCAELLKSLFYKNLRKERGEIVENQEIQDAEVEMPDAEGEDVAEPETEAEMAQEADAQTSVLLYVNEENAFKRMYAQYKGLRAEFLKQQELQKEQNLKQKQAIIEELKVLVEKQEDLNHTFPEFRTLQTRWKEVGPVPIANTKDIWDTYQHYVEKFYDYVKINNELRDLDFKKNLEIKTVLCEKSEELLLEPSIISAFHRLQKLHDEWRESGPVAREHREQVWERFKTATSAINKKHQEYFEEQKVQQKKNLEEKTLLCEKVEEIAAVKIEDANDWNKYSKEVENLQKLWRTIGFASKKDNQKIYDRFRTACNTFYNTKRQFYSQFKQEMQENYDRKLALCEKAEALRDNDDWRKTTDLFIDLQRQWKEIGPVARKQSDQIWKRFRTACDAFFDQKSKHFKTVDGNYEDNLKGKQALLEEIRQFVPSNNGAENLAALKEFQRRWAEIGFVPIKEKEKIQAAYRAALDVHFSALRGNEGERRINKFKKRVEDMHSGGKPERAFRSEREKLVYKFRQMEADIAVWENNMGFFAKSKNADSLIADIEKKVAKAKEELQLLEEKIKLMDQQLD